MFIYYTPKGIDMKTILIITALFAAGAFALVFLGFSETPAMKKERGNAMKKEIVDLKKATLAGGCFWCVESDLEKIDGVVEVVSGYSGGETDNPTYEEVSSGKTGHAEAVQVLFDPEKVSYRELLDVFWRHIDPTDSGGQFVDRGNQYRSAIFYHDEEQRREAEASRKALQELSRSNNFSKRRIIIRIITRPTPSGTNSIATVRVAISSSIKSGETAKPRPSGLRVKGNIPSRMTKS